MVSRPRYSRSGAPEQARSRAETLLRNFEAELASDDLRRKVLALVPVFRAIRHLGRSLIPGEDARAARDRILYYLRKYPSMVVDGDELMVVSGIQDYPRRIRELRVQFGWSIASGATVQAMLESEQDAEMDELAGMKPNQYVLLDTAQDREAALRWNVANTIRRQQGSARDKILDFLRHNVGRVVTGEELRYVAKGASEWARRVRELRTEFGWPVVTRATGRPDLPVGTYVLEADRQSPEHDRKIPDAIRRAVLRRDGYRCTRCGWSHEEWNRSDPRHLELHHRLCHAMGGENTEGNLVALCTVCHDEVHRATA